MTDNAQAALPQDEQAALPQQEGAHAAKVRRRKKPTGETEPATTREPGDDNEPANKLPPVEIRGWHVNNQAGVQLLTYANRTPDKKRFEAWIKYRDGKPTEQVRQVMKENGFKWHADVPEAGMFKGEGAWVFPIGYLTGAQDRLNADRVYREVVDQIYKEKGIEREPEGRTPF